MVEAARRPLRHQFELRPVPEVMTALVECFEGEHGGGRPLADRMVHNRHILCHSNEGALASVLVAQVYLAATDPEPVVHRPLPPPARGGCFMGTRAGIAFGVPALFVFMVGLTVILLRALNVAAGLL